MLDAVTHNGLETLIIHRDECWLAERLVRVLDYLHERHFLRFTIVCFFFTSSNLRNTPADADTIAAATSNTYDLENIKVPMDVLYIRRMDISLISHSYMILFSKSVHICISICGYQWNALFSFSPGNIFASSIQGMAEWRILWVCAIQGIAQWRRWWVKWWVRHADDIITIRKVCISFLKMKRNSSIEIY